jgi:hypothetical protein
MNELMSTASWSLGSKTVKRIKRGDRKRGKEDEYSANNVYTCM